MVYMNISEFQRYQNHCWVVTNMGCRVVMIMRLIHAIRGSHIPREFFYLPPGSCYPRISKGVILYCCFHNYKIQKKYNLSLYIENALVSARCNKGCAMCYHVLAIMHVKGPYLFKQNEQHFFFN